VSAEGSLWWSIYVASTKSALPHVPWVSLLWIF
jgi:hypothetical protein